MRKQKSSSVPLGRKHGSVVRPDVVSLLQVAMHVVVVLAVLVLAGCTAAWGQSHFPSQLLTYPGNTPLDSSARKVVILIHGWNPGGGSNPDVYQDGAGWQALRGNLVQALSSEWKVVPYHWEQDADTGTIYNFALTDLADWGTATTAAAHASVHGGHIADLLNQFPDVRQVHFIAHSAGAWAARSAAELLLIRNPYVTVDITLLDPYIPDAVSPLLFPATGMSTQRMSDTQYLNGNARIRLLENYYDNGFPPGTQEVFSWRAFDINQIVNWGAPAYYHSHGGPIQFYADTMQASIQGQTVPAGLFGNGCPFAYSLVGWFRSLFAERYLYPQFIAQPHDASALAGANVTVSVSASDTWPLSYQWYKDGVAVSGATGASYTFPVSGSTSGGYVAGVSGGSITLYSDKANVSVDTSSLLAINSVSPSALTGLPLPQTQPFHIYGSGFTGSSTLTFDDGVNAPYTGRVPTFVSANQLNFNIAVGTNAANWTVKVVNGNEASAPYSFSVVAPPPPSVGSLAVTLQPAGAVAAGGQWQVDGGAYRNSGDTVTGLSPGSHTISCKGVSGYTAPASHSVSITGGTVTADTETYSATLPSTYTLTLNQGGSMGSISPSPVGTWNGSAYVYSSGSVVQLTASANPGYHFVSWSGDVSGSGNPMTVTMNGNKSVMANFASGDPNMGTVVVTIQPPAAAAAGVTWGFNENDYRASGSSYTTWPASYILTLHPVDGWLGPPSMVATITAGETSNYVATFTADTTPGLLTVPLSPPDAVTAGAKWHVNGGAAQGDGATVSLAAGTNYVVTFDAVSGWVAPLARTVSVQRAQTTVMSGNYTPPAGQPVIGSISPAVGPMSGGTVMTINGANFGLPASVLVGGQPASNVLVVSSTQITCLTPLSTNYGSAKVVVQSGAGSATNLNGFAYGVANGSKIDLLSAIGGSCFGVAVQGNYAYAGEGRRLLVLDVSSPSAPAKVGQVVLPGVVRGIALFGHYAYVAAQEGGVQVVDISSPANPVVCGSFRADGYTWTDGIAIFGGLAYVANENLGLQVLDLGNPAIPTLLSSTNVGGGEAVVVKASANGVFAYVSTGGSLCVVDVSTPASPRLRGQTSINGGSCYSVAILGNCVVAASLFGNLEILDISNPDTPADIAHAPGIFWPSSVGVANNYVYAASSLGGKGFYVFSLSGTSLTQVGNLASYSSDGFGMALTGSTAYVPDRASGVKVLNIANPNGPSQLATFGDSGVFRSYNSVAVTQNSMAACGYPQGTVTGFNTVFDVSNPSAPSFAANPNVGGSLVLARNGIAHVLAGSSNFIFNISTPSSPQILKLFANSAFPGMDMALAGNVLYIVGYSAANQPHLVAFDVSSPSSPAILGSKDFTEFSAGVATAIGVSGTKGLVGIQVNDTATRFVVISLDLSNPSSPAERGAYTNLSAFPKAIAMSPSGDFAFVLCAGSPSALSVFDMSQPTAPSLVTNVPIDPASGTGLKLSGNELIASTFQGVYVFDVSNPGLPVMTRSYQLAEAQAIGVSSESANQVGNIYVADLDGGLVVLREQDIQAPSVYITNPTFSSVYTNLTPTVSLGGGSDDNLGVTAMTWLNERGGGGAVGAPFDSWYVSGIRLYPGSNLLTVTAFDAAGNAASDTLTVVYPSTNQNQTITFPAISDRTFGGPPVTLLAAASSGLPVAFSVVSGPGSLIGSNVLALTGAGTVTVQANQAGDGSFNAAPPVNVSFNVAKADQAITFPVLGDKSASDPPFSIGATASSGLQVFYTLSGPATLESNVVTLLGGGTVAILVWQPGNSNFNAASSVQRSFNVSKVPQSVTFGPLSGQRAGDAPFPLIATSSSGLPVTFGMVSGPATLSGNIITLTGWGTVVVRASQSGNATFAPALDVLQSFFVAPQDNTLVAPQRMSDGTFRFVFYGLNGSNYTLQATTTLGAWGSLFSFVCSNSPMFVVDASATNYNERFYRTVRQ